MSIKVQWGADGPFAVCDTPSEAMELLKQARTQNGNGTTPKPHVDALVLAPAGAESRFDTFLAIVNEKGKLLLKMLLEAPSGVEGDLLSKTMNIDSSGLGGIMGSLSKAAGKAGLKIGALVISEARFEGDRRYRWMAPGKLLLEHKGRLL
jgi:hypothetical protein